MQRQLPGGAQPRGADDCEEVPGGLIEVLVNNNIIELGRVADLVPCNGHAAPDDFDAVLAAFLHASLELLDVRESIRARTSADDADASKPAPDIFLAAAADLGASPADCVVFEDSPFGLAGALGAGMHAVAMPDPVLGERACAFATLRPGAAAPTLDALSAYLLEKGIAKIKLPERLVVVAEMPMTPTRKIMKGKLALPTP